MPTIFSHGAVGFIASRLGLPNADRRVVLASIIVAVVPDLDALFIRAIPYSHPFGHRGFSHSLFFAALLGLSVAFLFVKADGRARIVLEAGALFGIDGSHGFSTR